MKITTYLSPKFLPTEFISPFSLAIVVDVLRATTTITTALANGVKEIFPALSVADATKIAAGLGRGNFRNDIFLCGERKGLRPEGFDLGNSPMEYSRQVIENKTLVFTTTNGTSALHAVRYIPQVVVGSFINLSAVAEYTSKLSAQGVIRSVDIVCAGTDGGFAIEDFLFAGALSQKLRETVEITEKNDETTLAEEYYSLKNDNILNFIFQTHHAKRLVDLGMSHDVEYCFQQDTTSVIPTLINGAIKIPKDTSKKA